MPEKDGKELERTIERLVWACKDAISKIDACADGQINFRRDFADRLKIVISEIQQC